MLPVDQKDETGKQGMGRSESIWNELNVIGVTDGIYNDTVAISKASQYYTPEIVAALQDCFINIINTEEGKAIFDVYSHTGYAKAVDSDYDGAALLLRPFPNNNPNRKAPCLYRALFPIIHKKRVAA